MADHVDKTQECYLCAANQKSLSPANESSEKQSFVDSQKPFIDNRPQALLQRKLQELANTSHRANQAA